MTDAAPPSSSSAMLHVLVTRPAEDAEAVSAALTTRGMVPVVAPLLDIVPVAGVTVALDDVQGILATSANGIRAFAAASPRRDVAVWAVGDATARAAQALGFATVASAGGDVDSLAAMVSARVAPDAGALVHVAGSAVAGDLSGQLSRAGFSVRRAVLYHARTAESLTPVLAEALRAGSVGAALFFSPRTAATFVRLVAEAGMADRCAGLTAFALSPAVAEALAALPWRAIRTAAAPNQDALLAALDRMHGSGGPPGAEISTGSPDAGPAPDHDRTTRGKA